MFSSSAEDSTLGKQSVTVHQTAAFASSTSRVKLIICSSASGKKDLAADQRKRCSVH